MILTLLEKQGVHKISKDLIYTTEEITKNCDKIQLQRIITLKELSLLHTKSC